MVTEARLERLASGLAPVTPGWFIVNTADAAWVTNESYGGVCIFELDHVVLQGRPDLTEYEKPDAGFTIRVVPPRRPSAEYHAESVQEDFLILMGECVLIIEDQERHLRAWDFVHCPSMTAHAFVATGPGPCVIHGKPARRSRAGVPPIRGRAPLRRG
jgi:mannose-6-phosphate isomerase-like protein (cupin superfamily)